MNLRHMRWWDIETIMPLEAELFGQMAWSTVTMWSELAAPDCMYWVMQDGGDIAGYAGVSVRRPDSDVQTIAVSAAYQRQGIGARLLDQLLDYATEHGATSTMLEVRADNDPAISLYASRGFDTISVRRRYYQPANVDALIMRHRIRESNTPERTP